MSCISWCLLEGIHNIDFDYGIKYITFRAHLQTFDLHEVEVNQFPNIDILRSSKIFEHKKTGPCTMCVWTIPQVEARFIRALTAED